MAFEVISVMAVMTNCALIGMNPQVQKLLPSDMTAVNIVLLFVIVEVSLSISLINPYLTNGFSHHYQLGESTFIFGWRRCDFKILFHFTMKFLKANRIAPDGTPRSAASHLGLYCLPMSHKGMPGLNELNQGHVLQRSIRLIFYKGFSFSENDKCYL